LIVLSACDTGVGKLVHGEGIIGLPYALYVAGNKNLLLTLWPIDDDATQEFMRQFFGYLKAGELASTALAKTKRAFARRDEYADPRFWAPFVLYGY
jgi:CHAT domain-containing protein